MVGPTPRGRAGRRTTIGVVEVVRVRGPRGSLRLRAKIDTGAARTSLDTSLAEKIGLGPVVGHVRIRSAAADLPEVRDIVPATIVIAQRAFRVKVAVTDRQDMRFRIFVGMDVLRRAGFLVDPRRRPPVPRPKARGGSP